MRTDKGRLNHTGEITMTDQDKASEVESADKKGDCLTPSATIVALFIFCAWAVAQWVMA